MIDQLKSMAIFARVVDEGTFRGAAKKLSISPAIVSIHVKKLEEKIGAPLLYRSTRSVTLTQDGKAFYQAAKAMMASARWARLICQPGKYSLNGAAHCYA